MPNSENHVYTEEDRDILAMMIADAIATGKTSGVYEEIAAEIGVSNPDAVRKYARSLGLPPIRLNRQAVAAIWEHPPVPDLASQVLHVEAERAGVGGDKHVPYLNQELFYRFLDACQGCDLIVDLGDDGQYDAFSKFAPRSAGGDDLAQTVEWIEQCVDLELQVAERVVKIPGNHDFFLSRITNGALSPWALINTWAKEKYGDRVVFSKFPIAYLALGKQKWVLHHPDSYRVVPGSVAREFADEYSSNTICGHSHVTNESNSKGGYCAIDVGGLVDERKMPYRYFTDKPYSKWVPGWVVLTPDGHSVTKIDPLSGTYGTSQTVN
jgi:hypothetical protein